MVAAPLTKQGCAHEGMGVRAVGVQSARMPAVKSAASGSVERFISWGLKPPDGVGLWRGVAVFSSVGGGSWNTAVDEDTQAAV